MMAEPNQREMEELRRRLEEAEETLRAIRSGEVDALVVAGTEGERVYTLHGAEQPYRILIESMQQGAVTLDGEGAILYCNRSFADMVKRSHEKVIGTAFAEFLPSSQRPSLAAMLNQSRTCSCEGEFQFQAADGTFLPVYLVLNPLPLGDSVSICVVVTDLREQKKQQDLQEASQRKEQFLATLAHELRNPLAPVRNAVQILCMKAPAFPELQWATEIIERQVQQMTRLIDDLLNVSRISRNKLELRKERVDLLRVVQHAVETSQPFIEEGGHELKVLHPSTPIFLNADPTRLEQVLLNLLNNAAKYTEQGGCILLTTERQGSDVVVSVKDTGIGIPPEKLSTIFEMFSQVEGAMSRSKGGLGIGLYLVKRLVEMHDGTVAAHSEGPGKGCEFSVHLPILVEQAVPPTTGAEQDGRTPRSSFRILVVDDNKDNASSLAMLLTIMGNTVRKAYDG